MSRASGPSRESTSPTRSPARGRQRTAGSSGVEVVSRPSAINSAAAYRAVMASALNGDVFAVPGQGPRVIWDHQLYEMDVLAIPKGDPRLQRALDYVGFATGSSALAGLASWVPYGPARRSSLALVGANPDTRQIMTPHLPTLPANFSTAFAVDDAWWLAHGDAMAARWLAFEDGPH